MTQAAADSNGSVIAAIPGIVRIAATAWWRTAGWAAEASVRAGTRVLEAAVSGEPPTQFLRSAGNDARRFLRDLLDVRDQAPPRESPSSTASSPPPAASSTPRGKNDKKDAEPSLRDLGAELLRRSADVDHDDEIHPAYARILSELAPDEGRILRLLALDGPQPAVDVRTSRPLNVGSELVSPGLTMIGAQAGARHVERVPAYLNNLYRLGLVWFSREPLPNPLSYQVLEVQPDVLAAMRRAGRGRTVRRSIHLTPFGEDFCKTCLPLHTAELDLLPGDAAAAEAEPTA